MAKTKNPTGLSIARNNNVYACSWKLGENYDNGQQIQYRVNGETWTTAADVGNRTTAKKYTLNAAKFYPTTNKKLKYVKFAVRGRKNGANWSGWENKQFDITAPREPSVTVTPNGATANQCRFAWSVTANEKDARPFTDIEYQSMLLANSNTNDGSKVSWRTTQPGWRTGTGNANNGVNITETAGSIATGSHTRWFRVRSRGPGGASAWRYGRRVYAAPKAATVTKVKWNKTKANGTQVNIQWNNSVNYAYPCETVNIEYAVAVPAAGLTCPANASWQNALTLANTGNKAASITVPTVLEDNQCIWVRVNTVHLDKTTEGAPVFVRAWYIEPPTIASVTPDATTFRATITVTNPTQIPDAFVVVQYRTAKAPNKVATLGVIPPGETSITVQCPDWTNAGGIEFGIYAAVGSYKTETRADGVSSATVTAKMRSKGTIWQGGTVPQAPSEVTLSTTDIPNTIRVTWDWPWDEATGAVISWADHADAWESTDGPQSYEITNVNASAWNIAGITSGTRWYVRVRLTNGEVLGDWSAIAEIDLSSAPETPTLIVSAGIIPPDGIINASWSYVSTDGTRQDYAEVAEYIDGAYTAIAATQTAQSVNIYAEEQGWNVGETHLLAVRVVSASGVESDWGDLVPVQIAEPLTVEITQASFVEEEITVEGDTRTVWALTEMPLTVTVTGAGAGGITTVIIERAEDYHVDRPDETHYNGYEGETIAIISQTGEAQITINREDLYGKLDDGAPYSLVATVQDGLGQSASVTLDFEVHWSHQAVFPECDVTIMDNNIAIISPVKPAGWAEGDTCDIYRLSADKPELIYEGAEFNTVYVDPYPTIGEFSGHRIVYKTIDGDYITADNELAWIDITAANGDTVDVDYSIIDFDGEQILVRWNLDINGSWEKQFIETKYLGGSITGDWNKGVSKTGGINAVAIPTREADTIKAIRRLAAYEGICHVRTVDGASYACDIQVSDSMKGAYIYEYSLDITKVDPEELDGQTYAEYFPADNTVVESTPRIVITKPALGVG